MVGPPQRYGALLVAAVLVLGACGADSTDEEAAAADSVTVPDVRGLDGDEAVFLIEDEGLTAVLEDEVGAVDEAEGCSVGKQDPAGGSEASSQDEIVLVLDCRQRDWAGQDGKVWDDFTTGFSEGFAAGCGELFSASPNGPLFEGDDEYTKADCTALDPGDGAAVAPVDVPDDPHARGYELGFAEGCNAIFDEYLIDALSDVAGEPYTAADCAAAAAPPADKTGASPGSGAPCPVADANGQPVRVQPLAGDVACEGALALWREYLTRAPQEGQGSGGALTLEGWSCGASPESERPRLGTCESETAAASFAVVEA